MRSVVCIAAVVAGIAAGPARADGLPVIGDDVGGIGIATSGSPRYVALPAGSDTLVARIERGSGKVLGSSLLKGRFTIPAVAYDGSAGGLTRDGTRLVLISPRASFPRETTPLAVVGTTQLRVVRRITLRGDFSFDALSPNGRWIYLVHYTAPTDPLRYEVRALDAETGALEAKPVVDPREPHEQMGGRPLTRTTSADGRWAYTLYERPGEAPFVHALDTTGRTARCIDLDRLRDPEQLVAARLVLADDGRTLAVVSRGTTRAAIDTRSFAAVPPAQSRRSPASLLAGVIAVTVLTAAAVLAGFARRRRPKDARRPDPRSA